MATKARLTEEEAWKAKLVHPKSDAELVTAFRARLRDDAEMRALDDVILQARKFSHYVGAFDDKTRVGDDGLPEDLRHHGADILRRLVEGGAVSERAIEESALVLYRRLAEPHVEALSPQLFIGDFQNDDDASPEDRGDACVAAWNIVKENFACLNLPSRFFLAASLLRATLRHQAGFAEEPEKNLARYRRGVEGLSGWLFETILARKNQVLDPVERAELEAAEGMSPVVVPGLFEPELFGAIAAIVEPKIAPLRAQRPVAVRWRTALETPEMKAIARLEDRIRQFAKTEPWKEHLDPEDPESFDDHVSDVQDELRDADQISNDDLRQDYLESAFERVRPYFAEYNAACEGDGEDDEEELDPDVTPSFAKTAWDVVNRRFPDDDMMDRLGLVAALIAGALGETDEGTNTFDGDKPALRLLTDAMCQLSMRWTYALRAEVLQREDERKLITMLVRGPTKHLG